MGACGGKPTQQHQQGPTQQLISAVPIPKLPENAILPQEKYHYILSNEVGNYLIATNPKYEILIQDLVQACQIKNDEFQIYHDIFFQEIQKNQNELSQQIKEILQQLQQLLAFKTNFDEKDVKLFILTYTFLFQLKHIQDSLQNKTIIWWKKEQCFHYIYETLTIKQLDTDQTINEELREIKALLNQIHINLTNKIKEHKELEKERIRKEYQQRLEQYKLLKDDVNQKEQLDIEDNNRIHSVQTQNSKYILIH